MSLADDLKKNLDNSKKNKTQVDELTELFNDATVSSIRKYIEGVRDGSIEITSSADLARLFNIFAELNNLGDGEQGEGILPELPSSQLSYISDNIETVEKTDDSGNTYEEEVVDLDELSKISDEAYEELLNNRTKELNNMNTGDGTNG